MISREEAYNVLCDTVGNEAKRDIAVFITSVFGRKILEKAKHNCAKKGKWALERDLILAYQQWKESKIERADYKDTAIGIS